MGGGAYYEGLPHPHPTISYWQTPPHPLANHRSTPELPKEAEYVIAGSGITGTSIATKLLEQKPNADIVILEARTTCSGATGRNGGHCRTGFWTRFKYHLDKYGAEEALKLERLETDNVKNLTDFIKAEKIPCDLQSVETADVWLSKEEFDDAVENLRARDQICAGPMGQDHIGGYKVLSGKDAQEYFQMPKIAGGVAFRGNTLWPYKLVCTLMERVIAKGANLQTTTPVLSVERSKSSTTEHSWTVITERGHISCGQVILATNAYTGALCPPLASSIVPTRGQISAIRPGSNISGNPILKDSFGPVGYGIEDYMISRPAGMQGEGDIIYGGGRKLSPTGEQYTVDDSVINETIAEYLDDAAASYFGREAWGENRKTLMRWTGIMGYTEDSEPLIGEVPGYDGLWVCAGFNGHGMALTFQSAQALVDMLVTGKAPEWFPQSLSVKRVFK